MGVGVPILIDENVELRLVLHTCAADQEVDDTPWLEPCRSWSPPFLPNRRWIVTWPNHWFPICTTDSRELAWYVTSSLSAGKVASLVGTVVFIGILVPNDKLHDQSAS